MIGESEPPEGGSAILTFVEHKNARYRVVSAGFRRSGFTLTQLKRVGNVAIYKQTRAKQSPAFEVVIIRKAESWTAFGKEFPATEYYPANEDWGTYGFTYRAIEHAERKLVELSGEERR